MDAIEYRIEYYFYFYIKLLIDYIIYPLEVHKMYFYTLYYTLSIYTILY